MRRNPFLFAVLGVAALAPAQAQFPVSLGENQSTRVYRSGVTALSEFGSFAGNYQFTPAPGAMPDAKPFTLQGRLLTGEHTFTLEMRRDDPAADNLTVFHYDTKARAVRATTYAGVPTAMPVTVTLSGPEMTLDYRDLERSGVKRVRNTDVQQWHEVPGRIILTARPDGTLLWRTQQRQPDGSYTDSAAFTGVRQKT